ncbi:MAG: tyrosine--tRNA ligase [Candidatus Pacebacteria bacterium]|nr:tyrosine--tRNA ligase [Candidatus Paceibacterota bacterium]
MNISTDKNMIETVVNRGVERIFPNEDFLRARLSEGKQLTIYLGIDPTGPTLHMGHMIPLIKLRQLQNLGHKIILLIGDFTARIGDPDKKEARKQLTHEEILENCKLYKDQASSVLNFDGDNPAELKFNNDWLGKMNFADVLELASQMTVQRMLDRDMFRRRVESGTPVYIHEFMYPLMQGYDSVAMNVDGEVGGNDQTFNMLVGRDLLKNQSEAKEKFVIPMKLLVDNNGEKMGKTTGNMLSFLDSADEKFKKIMTWSDGMLRNGFELLTDVDLSTIDGRLDSDENPRDIKFDLAHAIVSRFHSEDEADTAKVSWINDVQKDNKPSDIPEIELESDIIETLAKGTEESKSQIRRSLSEGAVKREGNKLSIDDELVSGDTIQIGKKRWFKIK